MKKSTLVVLACAAAFSASAHRDVYFVDNPIDLYSGKHYTYKGAIGEEMGSDYVLMADGSFSHNGVPSIQIKHDQRNHGVRIMPNLSQITLKYICGTNDGGEAHVTPYVVVVDEDFNQFTFTFPMTPDDQTTEMEVTTHECDKDLSTLKRVNEFYIYFDGVTEEDAVVCTAIYMCSDWEMPVLDKNKTVYSKVYSMTDMFGNDPIEEDQEGVIYIQAEDFDEPWINGHIGHSEIRASASPMYPRLYVEDQQVYTATESNQHGDGSSWGRWVKGHGHIVSNRWGTDRDGNQGGGSCIANFIPSGDDWQHYYGEYTKDNLITFDQACAGFGAWAEYTFEAVDNLTFDLSLSVALHRAVHDQIKSNGSAYWWEDARDHGYALLEDEDAEWYKTYGFNFRVFVDGELLTTNFDAAPYYGGDGNVFEEEILDPNKWVNTQEEVNGEMVNSTLLHMFPCPFWGFDEPERRGCGWWPYYKSDLIKAAFDKGLCSKSNLDKYAVPDYVGIKVAKGMHTIKVQNLGGMVYFDELKLQVTDQEDGIEAVAADFNGLEGTPVYFDLQGRRVANPSNGIFIVRRGNNVTKEVIR